LEKIVDLKIVTDPVKSKDEGHGHGSGGHHESVQASLNISDDNILNYYELDLEYK